MWYNNKRQTKKRKEKLMKLSKIKKEELELLSDEQIAEILCGFNLGAAEDADVALVLGGNPKHCAERGYKASEIWKAGRVKTLIPSGGVKWNFDGVEISEAEYLADIMRRDGVPKEAILVEDRATTTMENMLYATILFDKVFRMQNVKSVIVVTSATHLRRSLGLAKLLLPRSVKVMGCSASAMDNPLDVLNTEHRKYQAKRELPLLKNLVDFGLIDDIEF